MTAKIIEINVESLRLISELSILYDRSAVKPQAAADKNGFKNVAFILGVIPVVLHKTTILAINKKI